MWSKILTASAAALFGAVGAMAGDLAPVQTASTAEADAIIASEPARAVPKIWAEADYLLWFERRQGVPLLVGTIPDSMVNTPNGLTGAANPLYPTNGKIDFRGINGLSARAGGQLTDVYGLDVGGFVLEKQNVDESFASTGTPSLVRTYLQPSSGVLQNLFSARIDPNGYPGSVRVHADSRLWGIDGNVRREWFHIFADRNDLLVGFRYINLAENLSINDRSDLGGGQFVNTVSDNFRTQNDIYVAQIGLQSAWYGYGRFDLGYFAKFGLGGARQRVEISGNNTFTGLPTENTGLYTQATNIGTFERTKGVAVGEVGFKIGYHVTDRINVQVGYNVLYVSSVVRPGAALDAAVNDANIRFIANPPADAINRRPNFDFARASTDFVAQGLTAGLSIRY